MEGNHVCCLLRQRLWLASVSQKFTHLSGITSVHYIGSRNWTQVSILALQALFQLKQCANPTLPLNNQLDQQGAQKSPVMALRNANKYDLHCLITEFSICFFPFLSELVFFWCSNFLLISLIDKVVFMMYSILFSCTYTEWNVKSSNYVLSNTPFLRDTWHLLCVFPIAFSSMYFLL